MRPLIIGADEAEMSGSDGSCCMMYFVPWLYLDQKRKGKDSIPRGRHVSGQHFRALEAPSNERLIR